MRAIGHCGTHSAALAPLIASMCIAPTRLRRHQYQYTQCQQQQREFYCGSSRHVRTELRSYACGFGRNRLHEGEEGEEESEEQLHVTELLHAKRSVQSTLVRRPSPSSAQSAWAPRLIWRAATRPTSKILSGNCTACSTRRLRPHTQGFWGPQSKTEECLTIIKIPFLGRLFPASASLGTHDIPGPTHPLSSRICPWEAPQHDDRQQPQASASSPYQLEASK